MWYLVEGLDYRKILKKAPFGYALYKIVLNEDGYTKDLEYIEINDVFEKITGLNKNRIIGKKVTQIFPNIKNENFNWIESLSDVAINDSESEFEQYSEELKTWYKVKLYSPKKHYVITYLIDITNEIKEKELNYITYHDGLTGVYNRNFFNKEVKNIDLEDNLPISVIMGDVNGLKLTNDAFGHLIGDKLLIAAANIMERVCRDNDIVVRWGGDEFIILLPKTTEREAEEISEKIKDQCIKEKIELINISISLGCSTKNNKDFDIMKTITKAEEMMYKVKMLESKSVKSRTLQIIINTLYEKSKENNMHSKNVSKICKVMGETMNMTKEKISELEILGDIHDIGKIGVSENILNKAGKLNNEEWEEIKKHPQIGYHIIASSNELSFLVDCVLAHHEWYDGSGYPKGIKGKEIPLMARILAIADTFDSMTSYRAYKKSSTKDEAIKELIKYSGSQFDPELVKVFTNEVIKKLDFI